MEEFKLKLIIYDYFYPSDVVQDINKNPKGTNQRFHEMLADDWDKNLIPYIHNLVNSVYAEDIADNFLSYSEEFWGFSPIVDDIPTRKKFIKYLPKIYATKGTLVSYNIVFKLLGFEGVEIEELDGELGFDSIVTLDDKNRRFDLNECQPCSKYILKIKGTKQLTEDLYKSVIKAVEFLEPIHAKLYAIMYNDGMLDFTIFVQSNGDLNYKALAVDVDFELSENGDLTIIHAYANEFYIENGDLKRDG